MQERQGRYGERTTESNSEASAVLCLRVDSTKSLCHEKDEKVLTGRLCPISVEKRKGEMEEEWRI